MKGLTVYGPDHKDLPGRFLSGIKRLGIYQLLIEHKDVREAADFMRGMGWREIARLCKERGF